MSLEDRVDMLQIWRFMVMLEGKEKAVSYSASMLPYKEKKRSYLTQKGISTINTEITFSKPLDPVANEHQISV